jgi:hypothetical protein
VMAWRKKAHIAYSCVTTMKLRELSQTLNQSPATLSSESDFLGNFPSRFQLSETKGVEQSSNTVKGRKLRHPRGVPFICALKRVSLRRFRRLTW